MNLLDLIILLAAIAYAIGGFRSGAVVGGCSLVGFLGGAIVGAQLARPLGSHLAHGRAQVPVAVCCVLLCAMLGQLLGAWAGGHVRARLPGRRTRFFDSGVGSLLGVFGVLIVAWMVAVPLASSPYPKLAAEATQSRIVRGVNDVMPNEVRTLYRSMRNFLDQSGFPPVFGALDGGPNAPVGAPPALTPLVRSMVNRVHTSVVKVLGQAPSCSRSIEGSGFVYAPHRVLTNAHVVAGTDQLVVQSRSGARLSARVVLYDPDRDVAVLDVPGLSAPTLRLAAHPAGHGAPGVVLGFPEDGPYTVGPARVRSHSTVSGNDIYGNSTRDRDIYSLRAIVRSGNSGGPLVADDGNVLGMVFATSLTSSDTGYALTAGEIRADADTGRRATTAVSTQRCTPG